VTGTGVPFEQKLFFALFCALCGAWVAVPAVPQESSIGWRFSMSLNGIAQPGLNCSADRLAEQHSATATTASLLPMSPPPESARRNGAVPLLKPCRQ
jgi:hypothetical protein